MPKNSGTTVHISFYEIYGGKVFDLLNQREQLKIMEDHRGKIQVKGLEEKHAKNSAEMRDLINYGYSERTTFQTAANDTSSRSHAILMLKIRNSEKKLIGKLLIVDLAGSERAADT